MENVTDYAYMEQDRPVLEAELRGGEQYPEIRGKVYVYILPGGIYLQGDFRNMPINSDFAFHVHEGLLCEGKGEKILLLPDVFSDGNGNASMQVCLDRALHSQIADRPIVVHLKSDGGESTVACGLLRHVL